MNLKQEFTLLFRGLCSRNKGQGLGRGHQDYKTTKFLLLWATRTQTCDSEGSWAGSANRMAGSNFRTSVNRQEGSGEVEREDSSCSETSQAEREKMEVIPTGFQGSQEATARSSSKGARRGQGHGENIHCECGNMWKPAWADTLCKRTFLGDASIFVVIMQTSYSVGSYLTLPR